MIIIWKGKINKQPSLNMYKQKIELLKITDFFKKLNYLKKQVE